MTLPNERSRAVKQAREFLRSLLDKKATPRVPQKIREQAYWVLRHFPHNWEIDRSSEELPEIWGPIKED